jgi:phosphohistidine phosphatase SixA
VAAVKFFLVRASLAEAGGGDVPEANRFLSLAGRQLVRAVGNHLRLNDEPSFDRIVTSPHAVAVQTAELFADRVDYIGAVEVMASLGAGFPPTLAAQALLGRGETLAIIGEEPQLSALGAFLIGRPTFPPLQHAQVSFIQDRQPVWYLRADTLVRAPLLVA